MNYESKIKESGLTIYDPIEVGDPDLWIPSEELERMLKAGLAGKNFGELPIRTRSKLFNQKICTLLGYPIPSSFKKVQPRFFGQKLDKYVQKSNNLQVWNEELDPERRYAIIRVDSTDTVLDVKVVTGSDLALLDRTGTLTQKYQARYDPNPDNPCELISQSDTKNLLPIFETEAVCEPPLCNPNTPPNADTLYPIDYIFSKLRVLLGSSFKNLGSDQERNRGAELHKMICSALGYRRYMDDGRFPDIKNQLLEVKLQTSPTIDLGLVTPDSQAHLDIPQIDGIAIRHCDIRYAVFYGEIRGENVFLTNLLVSSGEDFLNRCPQFQGKKLNKKLQIPLPSDFFSENPNAL